MHTHSITLTATASSLSAMAGNSPSAFASQFHPIVWRLFTQQTSAGATQRQQHDVSPAALAHKLDALLDVHIIMSCSVSPSSIRCAMACISHLRVCALQGESLGDGRQGQGKEGLVLLQQCALQARRPHERLVELQRVPDSCDAGLADPPAAGEHGHTHRTLLLETAPCVKLSGVQNEACASWGDVTESWL